MRAALRVSTKLSSSYDSYYIKFNPALFSRSSNFEDARVLSIWAWTSCSPNVFWLVSWCWLNDTWALGTRWRKRKTHLFTLCIQQWNSKWQKKLEKYLWKNSNFSRQCKLKSEFGECVYDSKLEHRRLCRILWLFMLVVLLETSYRTIQRNTGKLKSFT